MRSRMSHLISHSWPMAFTAAMILASAAVLLFAAWHDVVSRTVPNWMSLLVACFGIAAAFASGRLLISASLGLIIFIAAEICWRRGWMGGADVKLLRGIAIVLPPGMVSMFAIAMSLAGAAHAITYMLARPMVTRPPPIAPYPRHRGLLPRALRAERWRISRG